jgi:hypothetical protein
VIDDGEIISGRVDSRWHKTTRRNREKNPAEDASEVPLTHRDIREGWGVLNRR